MSDEEKIKEIKQTLSNTKMAQRYTNAPKISINYIADMETLLDMIERLEKELAQERENVICKFLSNQYIHKDRIRTTIKEIKHYRNLARKSIIEKVVIADSDSINFGRKQAHAVDIELLERLLGE